MCGPWGEMYDRIVPSEALSFERSNPKLLTDKRSTPNPLSRCEGVFCGGAGIGAVGWTCCWKLQGGSGRRVSGNSRTWKMRNQHFERADLIMMVMYNVIVLVDIIWRKESLLMRSW